MHYLDTSLLVAALSAEGATASAQSWLAVQPAESLLISDWTITEFSSAMAIKLRTGQTTIDRRAIALAQFNRLVTDSFAVLEVTRAHFRAASRFVDQHGLGLRSGDALHLAIAHDHGAAVQTLDRRLAAAGPLLGIPTNLLT